MIRRQEGGPLEFASPRGHEMPAAAMTPALGVATPAPTPVLAAATPAPSPVLAAATPATTTGTGMHVVLHRSRAKEQGSTGGVGGGGSNTLNPRRNVRGIARTELRLN